MWLNRIFFLEILFRPINGCLCSSIIVAITVHVLYILDIMIMKYTGAARDADLGHRQALPYGQENPSQLNGSTSQVAPIYDSLFFIGITKYTIHVALI